jgi:uncharacterized protein YigE (DUF2233 family)
VPFSRQLTGALPLKTTASVPTAPLFKADTKRPRPAYGRLATLSVLLFATLVLTSAVSFPAHAQTLPASVQWQPLGNDLERSEFTFNVGAVFTSSIVLVRSELQRYRLRTIRASEFGWKRATVRALCRAAGATVCSNANFFDEQGKALGLVISRGIIHQKIHKGGSVLTGILFATSKSVKVLPRDAFSPSQAVEAVQSGPRLVSGAQPVSGLHDGSLSSNLSGACIDTQGRLVIFRVTSGVFGCTIRQLQNVLLSPLINCVDAINFDGGGSSQLYVSDDVPGGPDRRQEEFLSGLDPVPVAVGLFYSNP